MYIQEKNGKNHMLDKIDVRMSLKFKSKSSKK